jgi:hypothetical protein
MRVSFATNKQNGTAEVQGLGARCVVVGVGEGGGSLLAVFIEYIDLVTNAVRIKNYRAPCKMYW